MNEAKEAMLARIRQALAHPSNDDHGVQRKYHTATTDTREAVIASFARHVVEYRATLERVERGQLSMSIAAVCAQRGVKRLVAPTDIPAAWIPVDVEILRDEPPLSSAELDTSDGVLTGCCLAIAQTGTIVLNGGVRQGRRALSLVPDLHLCVVEELQIVSLVPEAIQRLAGTSSHPITFISGPSATSDIELSRVEGVHGPRTLIVLLVLEERR